MKKLHATASYAVIQAALWSLYALLLSFSSNYLMGIGLDSGRISLVLGTAAALAIITQLALAEIVSRRELKLRRILTAIIACMFCLGLGMLLAEGYWAVGCFLINCMLLQTLPAMGNSLGMSSIAAGSPIEYGPARGTGSLSFAGISYAAGMLTGRYGHRAIPVMILAFLALFMLGLILFARFAEPAGGVAAAAKKKSTASGREFLLRHKRFSIMLIGCVLMYLSNNLIINFMLQIMQSKGGGAAEQGLANAIAGALEIPGMFTFVFLLRFMGCGGWLRISVVFMAVKALGIFLAPSPQWVYVSQLAQLLGYALFYISAVHYAEKSTGGEDSVLSQSYLASTSTIASLIGLSTGGVLCQQLGANAMLAVSTASAVCGAALIIFSMGKVKEL